MPSEITAGGRIVLLLSAGFVLLGLYWLARLWSGWSYVARHAHVDAPPSGNWHLCIVLPALEETRRLGPTVDWLLRIAEGVPRVTVAIATTEREAAAHQRTTEVALARLAAATSCKEVLRLLRDLVPTAGAVESDDLAVVAGSAAEQIAGRSTTLDVARDLARRHVQVRWIHAPMARRGMAGQINHAVLAMADECRDELDRLVFAVYNADSRPDPRTFPWVLSRLDAVPDGPPPVFQQYGYYLGNQRDLRHGVLTGAGAWQTRWSIGFELRRALGQFRANGLRQRLPEYQPRQRPILNYCIGHGLFFKFQTFTLFGGLSESTFTEDAMFGLQASFHGIPIIPVPFLEGAHSPETMRSLLVQKTTWCFGPLQAFTYRARIEERSGPLSPLRRARLLFLTASLMSHAVIWLLCPALLYILLALALLDGSLLSLGCFAAAYLAYFWLPNVIAMWLCKRSFPELAAELDLPSEMLHQLYGGLVVFLLHGLSALRAWGRYAMFRLGGTKPPRERTPLREHFG